MHMFIVLKFCVRCGGVSTHFTVLLGCLVFGLPVEKRPIAYHEPQGGLCTPETPILVRGGACKPPPGHAATGHLHCL